MSIYIYIYIYICIYRERESEIGLYGVFCCLFVVVGSLPLSCLLAAVVVVCIVLPVACWTCLVGSFLFVARLLLGNI